MKKINTQNNKQEKNKHGGNIAAMLQQYGLSEKHIIDFSANINPLGLPKKIINLIFRNIDAVKNYPQPQSERLKEIIARTYKLKPDNLLVGNGSIELIYLISRALKLRKVAVIAPDFSEYETASKMHGAEVDFFFVKENEGFKIDILKLKKFIKKSDAFFLSNPNNPTGRILQKQEMLLLMDICRLNKTLLIVDEAFMEFVDDATRFSLMHKSVSNEYLLVLRSATKFFALAGLRLGYLIGQAKLIKKIAVFEYPWNVNCLAQLAGGALIQDSQYARKSRHFVLKEKDRLLKQLQKIPGIKTYPAAANFIFCKLETKKIKTAEKLYEALAKKRIFIRDCANFRGLNNQFFRIAVRARKENIQLIEGMNLILNQ